MMRMPIAIIALFFAIAGSAMADGIMVVREEIPPKIPYQRALILFDKGVETLVLQSRYKLPDGQEESVLGWVVPVPAVPEVASIPAYDAHVVFGLLDFSSSPDVTEIAPILLIVALCTVFGLSSVTLLLCLISFVWPFSERFMLCRGQLARFATLGVVACVIVSFFVSLFGLAGSGSSVEVVSAQQVGIYDVRVIRSDDADALVNWLNENQFKLGERQAAAFQAYVSKGWCFVVACIRPGDKKDEWRRVAEGLAAPLILRFPHPDPVYPVAVTGTGGFETEILVYLASKIKMTCNNRLALRFAGSMGMGRLDHLLYEIDPKEFFADVDLDEFDYLCKFKGRLKPEEMAEDIVFVKDPDTTPYREHVFRW